MNENERIVCEFLRKIAPSREWRYLGEVEHYWIGELCDELNKQLKAENAKLRYDLEEANNQAEEVCIENAKLRELCAGLLTGYECGNGELCKGCTWDGLGDSKTFSCLPRAKARELGVGVDA